MDSKIYWFVFSDRKLVLNNKDIILSESQPFESDTHIFDLPDFNGKKAKAFGITKLSDSEQFETVGLRDSYFILDWNTYYLAGKAYELVFFDRTHQFCSIDGNKMVWSTNISKKCSCCGNEIWPDLKPAIIVLVSRNKNQVLMTHGKNFKGNFMGIVSGFVETGESLEECIQREVMEETGIKIKDIRYFKSQPWPYPTNLMIGFFAEYESGEIKMQEEELTECRWVNRNEMPELAPKLSIARQLIEHWLAHPDEF